MRSNSFFRLTFLPVAVFCVAFSSFAQAALSSVQDRVPPRVPGGKWAGGKFGGRMGSKSVRLGEQDPGVLVTGKLTISAPEGMTLRPALRVRVWDKRYLGSSLGSDGSFSIKVPEDAEWGLLEFETGGYRFLEDADFYIEDGEIRFATDLAVETGCFVELEISDQTGDVIEAVSSQLHLCPRAPALRRNQGASYPQVGSAVSSNGLLAFEPVEPSERLWAVISCPGYATVRLPLPAERLSWGGTLREKVVLMPMVPVTIQALDGDGSPAEGAVLRVNHEPMTEDTFILHAELPSNPATVEEWAAGTYYASVSGPGFLSAQHAFEIQPDGEHQRFDLSVNRGFGVRGQLVWADGQPVAGAKVSIRPVVDGGRPSLSNPSAADVLLDFGTRPLRKGETDAQGRFLLSGFERAKSFELLVESGPPASSIPAGLSYIESRKYLREKVIWASYSGMSANLELTRIVLEPSGNGIRGLVSDDRGEPIADYTIRAFADCDGPVLEACLPEADLKGAILGKEGKPSTKSEDGSFAFDALRVGSWCLLVSSPGHATQVIRSVEPGLESVAIALPRIGQLSARVLNPSGKGAARSRLALTDQAGNTRIVRVKASLRAVDFPVGTYRAQALAKGLGVSAPKTIRVLAEDNPVIPEFQLGEPGRISVQVEPRFRELNPFLRFRPVSGMGAFPVAEVSSWLYKLGPNGKVVTDNLTPGTYLVDCVRADSSNAKSKFSTGFHTEVQLLSGETVAAQIDPEVDAVKLTGSVRISDLPYPGWLYMEDVANDQLYAAPIDNEGRYETYVPSGVSYRVYACKRPRGRSADDHLWLGQDWLVPDDSVEKDWSVPSAQVRLRWVDQSGEPILWGNHPKPVTAYWYADHDRQAYGFEGVIASNGVVGQLLPGGTYRIHLQGTALSGDWLEVRDVPFQVPTDGSIRTIDIPCVGFGVE